MSPGFVPVATLPEAEAPTSAPAALAQWDLRDGREVCVLMVARPYDLAASSAAGGWPVATLPEAAVPADGGPADPPVYAGTHPYRTDPEDPALPNVSFAPRLRAPGVNFQTSIPTPEGAARGQGDVGSLVFDNADGGLDPWLRDLAWSGRPVDLYAGTFDRRTADGAREHPSWSGFRLVLRARAAAEPEADGASLTLRLKSSGERLDRPLQTELYAGTGGREGGAEIAGRPKPLSYGRRRQVEPVLVSAALLLYQVHDGSVAEIDAVRDRGAPLAPSGNFPDLEAWTPAPGGYATDLSRGMFRLGGSPVGAVTCDLRGDNAGGYVDRAAEIARRLAVRAGLSDAEEIDGASFWAAAVANQATTGWGTTEPISAAQALDEVLLGIGARWSFGRDDRLRLTVLGDPAESEDWSFDQTHIAAAETLAPEQPLWRARVGWGPYARTLGPAELAGSVSESDRQGYGLPSRWAEGVFGTTLSLHPLAEEAEIPAFFDLETDAKAEAARRVALRREAKMLLRVRLLPRAFFPFQMNVGETVRVAFPRFGLNEGARFVLVGLAEVGLAATLTLWGPRPERPAEACALWPLELGFGCEEDAEAWGLPSAA